MNHFLRVCCLGAILLMFRAPVQAFEIPSVNGDPTILENGALLFRVQGEFEKNEAEATESAFRKAQQQIRGWLLKQNPPIHRYPSLETIRREMNPHLYAPAESIEILSPPEKRYRRTVEITMRPGHLRDLREKDRVITGFWSLGLALGFLGMIALLFRIDEWTKGYLTRWLIAAGVLVTVKAALLGWWLYR